MQYPKHLLPRQLTIEERHRDALAIHIDRTCVGADIGVRSGKWTSVNFARLSLSPSELQTAQFDILKGLQGGDVMTHARAWRLQNMKWNRTCLFMSG